MKDSYKLGFAHSLIGHATLLAILILSNLSATGKGSGSEKGGNSPEKNSDSNGSNSSQDKITEKPQEKIQIDIIEGPSAKPPQKPTTPHSDQKCEKSFGGIGVTVGVTPQGQLIQEVHKGYPADLAGFKPGDLILNGNEELRGEVGTQVTIRFITREGNQGSIKVIRDKICYEDNNEGN